MVYGKKDPPTPRVLNWVGGEWGCVNEKKKLSIHFNSFTSIFKWFLWLRVECGTPPYPLPHLLQLLCPLLCPYQINWIGYMYSDPIIDEVEEPPTKVTALQMSKCALLALVLLSPQSWMMDMPKC